MPATTISAATARSWIVRIFAILVLFASPMHAQLPASCGLSYPPMVQPFVNALCQDISTFQHISLLAKTRECEEGFGDGTTTLAQGPHTLTGCLNNYGGPMTPIAVHCISDAGGTLEVDSDDGTHLTNPAAFQCGPLGIGVLQPSYVTLQALQKLKFTFNSDGQTKSATFVVTAVIQ